MKNDRFPLPDPYFLFFIVGFLIVAISFFAHLSAMPETACFVEFLNPYHGLGFEQGVVLTLGVVLTIPFIFARLSEDYF